MRDLFFRRPQSASSVGSGKRKPGCVVCGGAVAKHRCSRCHSERYCGRDCQVKHWPVHKSKCQQRVVEEKERTNAQVERRAKVQEV